MPPHSLEPGGTWNRSLTMTYFHTGIRTIIGAEAFHCPVRDGKEWGHLAMVVRHNWLPGWIEASQANSQSRIYFKSMNLIAANRLA